MNKQYAICINNDGYAASLELRKVYQLLQDTNAKKLGLLRVIDESGENYLYSEEVFVPVSFSKTVSEKLESIL
ncbi:conserved hypothetical protein [Chloroherpeton thalassium ATCC 35110]|uniref:Uncharacterized protein n=1 Tax=Chloroherpeton thalassium (strain ATCC 35110 / GB-78) TaxID=517418 RepID=B3QW79_CHLT3|nr:hypothetical protein [Chloroherpeton thalassium]ACF13192.1 conserved hypothetical protein [Chloroherpeton thalassium ATCC 35110]